MIMMGLIARTKTLTRELVEDNRLASTPLRTAYCKMRASLMKEASQRRLLPGHLCMPNGYPVGAPFYWKTTQVCRGSSLPPDIDHQRQSQNLASLCLGMGNQEGSKQPRQPFLTT